MTDDDLLRLPDVALCCIDCTDRLPWSLRAMRQSLAQVHFGDAVLLTDRVGQVGEADLPASVRRVGIEPLRSVEAYSRFMLDGLLAHLRPAQSHVLVIQWDGHVLNAQAWSDEFLGFDYIGAPWPHLPAPHDVGNGGFSLRSRRLLELLREPQFPPEHPEDVCIGVRYRPALEARGLRFADAALARRFSVEEGSLESRPFGFHGPFHLPEVLDTGTLCRFIGDLSVSALGSWWMGSFMREMRGADAQARRVWQDWLEAAIAKWPEAMCRSEPGRQLCKALLRHRFLEAAAALLARRRQAGPGAWAADARLHARLAGLRLLGRGGAR